MIGGLPAARTDEQRIVVSGASGFIGSLLAVELARRYGAGRVIGIVGPVRSEREAAAIERLHAEGIVVVECDLLRLPRGAPPAPSIALFYHLAAYAETEQESGAFTVNNEGTAAVLKWLGPGLRGGRVIYTGTLASVDRDRANGPIDERTPCTPITPYGRSKLEGEAHVRRAAARWGYSFTILRLCTVIGKGYRSGGMFAVFPRHLKSGSLATRLNWPGRASYISVEDIVHILIRVATEPRTAMETYVVSNGEDPSFDQLLELMARILGLPRRPINLPSWAWSLLVWVAGSLARVALVPYGARIACWRVTQLIGDGTYATAQKLEEAIGPIRYRSIVDALGDTYDAASWRPS